MEWEAPWWDDWTGGGIANMISKVFKVAKTTLSRSETEPTRPLRLNQPNPLSSVALKAQWPAAHRTAISCLNPTSRANLTKKTSNPTFQAQNSPQRLFSPTPSTPKETMFKQRTKFRQETRQPWVKHSIKESSQEEPKAFIDAAVEK